MKTTNKCKALQIEQRRKLRSYRGPGNVREIENAIERAVLLSEKELIDEQHLPQGPALVTSLDGINVPGATMAALERFAILKTLEAADGSTTRAAEIRDISIRTIQYRLHQYGVVKDEASHRTTRSLC